MATPIEALAGVPNAHQPLPNVLTGGQPWPKHFEALKTAGVEVILDIRDPMEPRPFDEPTLVASLGMKYVNVPMSAATLTDETMERIVGVLRTNHERPVLFHCQSGNRVGGAMIAYLMLDHGVEEEAAITSAMRMGLRTADYVEWALDYVARRGSRKEGGGGRKQRGGSRESS